MKTGKKSCKTRVKGKCGIFGKAQIQTRTNYAYLVCIEWIGLLSCQRLSSFTHISLNPGATANVGCRCEQDHKALGIKASSWLIRDSGHASRACGSQFVHFSTSDATLLCTNYSGTPKVWVACFSAEQTWMGCHATINRVTKVHEFGGSPRRRIRHRYAQRSSTHLLTPRTIDVHLTRNVQQEVLYLARASIAFSVYPSTRVHQSSPLHSPKAATSSFPRRCVAANDVLRRACSSLVICRVSINSVRVLGRG